MGCHVSARSPPTPDMFFFFRGIRSAKFVFSSILCKLALTLEVRMEEHLPETERRGTPLPRRGVLEDGNADLTEGDQGIWGYS